MRDGTRAYIAVVLNLHGEALEALAPAGMTLEEAFLPTLKSLHETFPKLRIIVCQSQKAYVQN